MNMNLTRLALSSALLALATLQTVSANHIDFIVDGAFLLNTDSNAGLVTATQTGDGGNIIGAEREVAIDVISGVGFVSAGTFGAASGAGPVGPDNSKVLLFSNSVRALGSLQVTYDGAGAAGLGGVDFDTQWDQIDVNLSAVQGTGNLTVTVTDSSANSGALTRSVSSAGVFSFPFTDAGYAGVSFTAVDKVVVKLDTTQAASDFEIAAITREQVPEPSSFGLAILTGLLTWIGSRRRQGIL